MSFYAHYLPYGDNVMIYAKDREAAIKNFKEARFYYTDQEPHKLNYTLYPKSKAESWNDEASRIYIDKTLVEFIEV